LDAAVSSFFFFLVLFFLCVHIQQFVKKISKCIDAMFMLFLFCMMGMLVGDESGGVVD
jgi:hypothetical protein